VLNIIGLQGDAEENLRAQILLLVQDEIYPDLPFLQVALLYDKEIGNAAGIQDFVALDDKQVVGLIKWEVHEFFDHGSGFSLEISWLAVAGTHRRQGLGTRLIKETLPTVLSVLKAKGIEAQLVFIKIQTDGGPDEFYAHIFTILKRDELSNPSGDESTVTLFCSPELR